MAAAWILGPSGYPCFFLGLKSILVQTNGCCVDFWPQRLPMLFSRSEKHFAPNQWLLRGFWPPPLPMFFSRSEKHFAPNQGLLRGFLAPAVTHAFISV